MKNILFINNKNNEAVTTGTDGLASVYTECKKPGQFVLTCNYLLLYNYL